jgi:hypothetical protein
MDPTYLSYKFGNFFRNTYVIESKGVKGWITLRCIQTEYGENCVIDNVRGAQTQHFTPENGKRIKARYNKNENTYIGFDKGTIKVLLTPSDEIIIGLENA